MDIVLQGKMDGIEAAGFIMETHQIPVIFLTAHMDRGLLERAKQVKPLGYLIKPVQEQLLAASIEIALNQAAIERQRRKAEISLVASEERWRSLTENSADLIIELDDGFAVRFLNRPLPGLDDKELIGRPLTDHIAITECESEDPFREAMRQSVPIRCEALYQERSDRTIYYEMRIARCRSHAENEAHLIVSLRDLTSIQEISRKLLDRERWLSNTFQQAAVGIVHTDADGRFLRVNDRYGEIMGYPVAELLGRNYEDFTHPEFRQRQAVVRNQLLAGRIRTATIEKINIRRDGRPVWLSLTLSPVRRADGSIEYLQGIIQDITERKNVRQALEESEQKYRDLLEHIPQRVTYKNKELQYVAVNNRFAEDFGLKTDDFRELSDHDLFSRELAAQMADEDRRVMQTGRELETVYSVRIRDRERIFQAVKSPKTGKDGSVEGVLAVLTDITERIESEKIRQNLERDLQQTQKMQALGTLAGGVAHDFNNILHPIIGLSTLGMRINAEGSTNQKYFSDIKKAGNRATDLVSQILTFSRQGDQELKPVLLQPLIKEALKMLRASLPTTIAIETAIDEKCGKIKADPTRIHQIIMNLATNGYQAMEETGGTLSVSLQPLSAAGAAPAGGELVELRVRDTGTGIPPEYLQKIFDPYFTTKDVGHGTGLGLAVVMGIVESHHATIHVDSQLGKGSEFTICFPVTEETSKPATERKTGRRLSGSERVLVVDDEADIIFFLSEALKHMGYRVEGTSSSVEALEWFRKDPGAFDVVVTDMTMPVMTGYDLAMQILKVRPDVPVILCTGHSSSINEEKAIASGIRCFLPKPIDQDDLVGAIRQVLDSPQQSELQ